MFRLFDALRTGGARTCGVEILPRCVRAVVCDDYGAVVAWGTELVPADATAALRALRARLGRAARIVACGAPDWADAVPLRLPGGGGLEELLVERARAHLPYSIEDAVLDYAGAVARPDGVRRALLYGVPRSRALEMLAAGDGAGLAIDAIETSGTSLHRALRHARLLDERRTLAVWLDADHGAFLVADQAMRYVERPLAWGVARLEERVAASLGMPVTTAAAALRRPPDTEQVSDAVREIVGNDLHELGAEVERMIGYCRSEFRDRGIERVLLCGAAALWSVHETLDRLALVAEPGLPEQLPGTSAPGYVIAWGLALRGWEVACDS
jgi:Tfp pilus assembly PilM family ATPase